MIDTNSKGDEMSETIERFFASDRKQYPLLGKGGIAHVYGLDQEKAIKLYLKYWVENEQFLQIQQQLASLVPSAVPILHTGKDEGGESYLVMERIMGSTLESIKKIYPDLPKEMRFRVAADLIETACQLEDARICHGDLKPKNFILDTVGYPRIVDYDRIHQLPSHRESEFAESLAGTTPSFAAPERMNFQYTLKGDIYSVGVTLFALETKGHLLNIVANDDEMTTSDMTYMYRPSNTVLQKQIHDVIEKHVHDLRMRTLITEALIIDPHKRPRPRDLRHHVWKHAADREDLVKQVAMRLPEFAEAVARDNKRR